ncbi:MAG: PorV/PorQ family protein [Bacteroidota bacterium]
MRTTKAVFFSLFLLPLFLQSQVDGRFPKPSRAIGYLEFLSVDIASQNAALGNAGVANPEGGFLTNPALLANQQDLFSVSVNYSPWLRALGIPSLHFAAFQAGLKLSEKHAIGLNYQQFSSLDPLDFGFNSSQPFSQISPRISYAQNLKKISWGLSIAYVQSGNEQGLERRERSRGISLSGGISSAHQFWGADWLFAASINDWGPSHSARAIAPNLQDIDYFLPTTFRLGGQTALSLSNTQLRILYQVEHLLLARSLDSISSGWEAPFRSLGDGQEWREWQGMLGIEWAEIALGERLDLALRLGLRYESEEQGSRQLITTGLGLRSQRFSLDASYWIPLPQNHPLQNTITLGLSYFWHDRS